MIVRSRWLVLAAIAALGAASCKHGTALSQEEITAVQRRGLHFYKQRACVDAYRQWLDLAENGHAESQYNIALMTLHGQRSPRQSGRGIRWYRRGG